MADTKMTKSAGEHWVCSVLARHGWAAALTRDGLERTDILAVQTEGEGRQTIEVQVKSLKSIGARSAWPLTEKSQQPALSQHEWYILVLLDPKPTSAPRSFILPRDHAAAAAWIQHMDWLTDPAAAPGTRNAPVGRSRVGIHTVERYEDRWDFLGTPTDDIPVLLPDRFRELALDTRVGLPPDHPWHERLPAWS